MCWIDALVSAIQFDASNLYYANPGRFVEGMKPSKKKKKKSRASRTVVRDVAGDEENQENRVLNLMDAFSSASLDEAASVCREGKGDSNKAAEIWGDPLGNVDDPSERCFESNVAQKPVRPKGGNKKKKVFAAAGTVSSVLGKDYVTSSPKKGPPKSKGLSKEPLSREDAEQFLCSMLGDEGELSMAVVRDVLSQCGYDVEKLTDMASDSTFYLSENELREFLQSAGYDCRTYLEVVISSKEHLSRPGMRKSSLPQRVLESLFNIPKSSEHEINSMNWKNVVKKMDSLGQGLDFRSGGIVDHHQNTVHAEGDEYQVFRKEAKKHRDSMRSAYHKAATAYSRGEKGYAAYLSEQCWFPLSKMCLQRSLGCAIGHMAVNYWPELTTKGKVHNKMAQEADEKASQEIFEARNKGIENVVTIDLHGQHVQQAIQLVKVHLLLFTMYIPSVVFLRVITGCGNHGVGKGKLKKSVISLIEKEGIKWSEENRGTLVIRLDGPRHLKFMKSESDSK